MPSTDPRIDRYIDSAAPFAQPILQHLRAVVHKACPDVHETIKWGMPSFEHHGLLCAMAAFKSHCTFALWQGQVLEGKARRDAMGQFGRLTSVKDLPPARTLAGYVRKAAALNEQGITRVTSRRTAKPPLEVPADFAAALGASKAASAAFAAFSPSHRREYVEWITEAKRAETRARRIAAAAAWIAEGKGRNWQYER